MLWLGIGLMAMNLPLIPTSILIATITFIVCYAEFFGNRFSRILGERAKFIGGIILILIAFKTF